MIGFSKSQQLHKKETARSTLASNKQKQVKIKAKTARRKPLKLMSKRAKAEFKVTQPIKRERMRLLEEKFGYVPCELCIKKIVPQNPMLKAEYHHNGHDRRVNTLEDCRILHEICNQRVEDENIKDVPTLL